MVALTQVSSSYLFRSNHPQNTLPSLTKSLHSVGDDKLHPLDSVHFGLYKRAKIPEIDFSPFVNGGTLHQKREVARQIGEGLRDFGFVALTNHGLSQELLERHTDEFANFIANPSRRFFVFPRVNHTVGYFPRRLPGDMGERQFLDPKIAWQTMRDVDIDPYYNHEFALTNREFYDAMRKVGDAVSQALVLYFDNPNFEDYVTIDPGHVDTNPLRSLHYYPLSTKEKKRQVDTVAWQGNPYFVRTNEHKDTNLFTLLPQASASGLQMLSKKGEWLPIHTQDNTIIVNGGRLLELISEGLEEKEIKATPHRVIGSDQDVKDSRYSFPFLFYGDFAYKPLPHLQSGDVVRAMSPLTGQLEELSPALKDMYYRFLRSGTLNLPFDEFRERILHIPDIVGEDMEMRRQTFAISS